MSILDLTAPLQGAIGEIVFEHYSQCKSEWKQPFLLAGTRDILDAFTPKNRLKFRFKNRIIKVRIPDEIEDEIRRVCKPSNHNLDCPTFTPDFLSVPMGNFFKETKTGKLKQVKDVPAKYFNWIEVKTNGSQLTENQKKLKEASKIGFLTFRVKAKFPSIFEIIKEE